MSYRAAVESYAVRFGAGVSRADVERQLRDRGVEFHQVGGLEERTAYADLVKIGEEAAPWFCSEPPDGLCFYFTSLWRSRRDAGDAGVVDDGWGTLGTVSAGGGLTSA